MGHRVIQAEREVRRMLEGTGLDFEIRLGKKHQQLWIEGHMVFVFSNGARSGHRPIDQLGGIIRRCLKDKHVDF